MKKVVVTLAVAAAVVGVGVFAAGAKSSDNALTEYDVRNAQEAWGAALISISQTYQEHGWDAAAKLAREVLDTAYGYADGPVLFKPTLAHGEQTFRTTYDGALAYFVGGNDYFAQDNGFALKGWTEFSFENAAVHINGNTALTMGNVHLTNAAGERTTVDKTWAFQRGEDGQMRIILHHSSLPFTG
ncbi:phosphoribosyl-AMP cyclohydrolase [Aliidiomarina sanyensis]|uniref:Phosphoribosyl-AMP cyclohydrolase n=1 Tax=Aliidiomarina sanyensis TaxID=1249555 RepID=A0A432WNR9_9GAMM|nr:phosphoribosyl-AMP cyclohydrolase [Aliidiomarina sanyensis]RUO35401.1 phosphoribosyl-AMP cyclohydrolase [Aliidiomarina sanyensis]